MSDMCTGESIRREELGERILQALSKSGLHDLMMLLYDVFQAPILLADINTRVIFQYPLTEIGDEAYDTILKDKMLRQELVREHLNAFQHSEYDQWEPFYANKGKTAQYPRLYGTVCCNGIKQGVLAVFLGKREPGPEDLKILKMFLSALEIKLEKNVRGSLEWLPPAAVCLHDLLEASSFSYLSYAAQQALEKHLKKDYVVLVTLIGAGQKQRNFAAHVVAELTHRRRDLASVIFNDCIVTLLSGLRTQGFAPSDCPVIQELTKSFYPYGLISGCSMPFSDLSLLRGYYAQALATAQIAAEQPETPLLYSKGLFTRLIFRGIANVSMARVFLHPLLEEIREYDEKNNTVYFPTLKAYCNAFFDRDRAAEDLSVHRNTLTYRLNRMEEIFHLDMEDRTLQKELYCSFLLYDELPAQS